MRSLWDSASSRSPVAARSRLRPYCASLKLFVTGSVLFVHRDPGPHITPSLAELRDDEEPISTLAHYHISTLAISTLAHSFLGLPFMLVPIKYRQPLLLAILLLSVFSLFVSRAGLSISMIAFVVLTTVHKDIGGQLRRFVTTPVLAAMGLLFLMPLLSGLWSDDLDKWSTIMRIKLPLLFFPIAFAGNWQLTTKQWRALAFFFLAGVIVGVAWSLGLYLADFETHNDGFLRSKTFGTPLENDHVRFSWLVATATLLIIVLWKDLSRNLRIAGIIAFLFFACYLHVLAARTGLGAFYIGIGALAANFVWKRKKPMPGIALILALAALPFIAWLCLPSFRNRVEYIRYDFNFVENKVYSPGANDGNRFLSIRAGWDLLKQHPMGVGFGDIFPVTNEWYDAHHPGMLASDRYYPSSEWLIYGLGNGWLGVFLFTVAMLLPLAERRLRQRFWWIVLNASAAFSFLFDIGLEVQYGVYLYVFLILWWWKWLNPEYSPANYATEPIDRHHL
jgi:O-antigen ligase